MIEKNEGSVEIPKKYFTTEDAMRYLGDISKSQWYKHVKILKENGIFSVSGRWSLEDIDFSIKLMREAKVNKMLTKVQKQIWRDGLSRQSQSLKQQKASQKKEYKEEKSASIASIQKETEQECNSPTWTPPTLMQNFKKKLQNYSVLEAVKAVEVKS